MENQTHSVVLVCVNEHPRSVLLLRAAKNKAKELNTSWRVIHVESTNKNALERNNFTLQNITLAQQMGAEIDHIEARNVTEGILNILKKYKSSGTQVSSIYVGDDNYQGFNLFKKTIGQRLRNKVDNSISVEIIDLEGSKLVNSGIKKTQMNIAAFSEFIFAILAVIVATAIVELVNNLIPHSIGPFNWSRPIVYMAACAFVAGKYGLLPGIISAFSSYFIMNYFYISPSFNLFLTNEEDAVNLGLFLSSTILIALFVGKTHSNNDKLSLQMHRIQSLFKIYRASVSQRSRTDALDELHSELSKAFSTEVIFFLPTPINPDKLISHPKNIELTQDDEQALYTCWNESQVTGYGSLYNPSTNYRFIPLVTVTNEIGVFAIQINNKFVLDIPTNSLLSLTSDHIAFILERIELGHVMEESRVRDEREKLRAMLLSSVSHDLKTPLASVIGALSVFKTMQDSLSVEQKVVLIHTAYEEAQRLDSFITNILDMTRIETGQVTFKQDWIKPAELVDGVRKKIKNKLLHNEVIVLPPTKDNIEVCLDSMMTSQALQNVLENAVKYTPEGSKIDIKWFIDDRGFTLTIRDHGDGIAEGSTSIIFDKYTRILHQDRKVAGTGLGLAIAKLVMLGQKGNIIAENHPDGGAIFIMTFPKWREAKKLKE